MACLLAQVSPFLFFQRRLVDGMSMSWGETWQGLGASAVVSIRACRGTEVSKINTPSVRKHTGEVCKQRTSYSHVTGMCFTQTYSPMQGPAPHVSIGSLSPFQPRPAVWERLCQALAAAQEELQGCSKLFLWPL